MHAFLITGGTPQTQERKIEELLKQFSVFEKITLESNTIESIRDLRKKLTLSAKNTRAVVLKDVHTLTLEAANAFLKTLEEPPTNTIIVMTSPNADVVLETIVSRAQLVDLGNFHATEVDPTHLLEILNMSAGERLALLEKLGDREKALDFLKDQILASRRKMIELRKVAGELRGGQFIELIERMEKTREDLEANVNVKMALGDLLLNYPKLDQKKEKDS